MSVSPMEQFREAMRTAGIEPPDLIKTDGKLHRFSSDGRRGDDAGWYILHAGDIPAGAFGCWRSDIYETWRADIGRELTAEEIAANKRKISEAKRKQEEEKKKSQAKARARAAKIWDSAANAPSNHPYLATKGISAHGLRFDHDELVVPMYDSAGVLHNLQFIAADGAKNFLFGGRVTGCHHILGEPNGVLCTAEGYATAASIFEAARHAVAVGFNAANLPLVAKELRAKFSDLRFIICADDDARTPGNPGLKHAREAAAAVGGYLAVPDFGENRPEKASDFNDLHQCAGEEAVRACIERAVPVEVRAGHGAKRLDDAPCMKSERFTDLGNARRLVRFYGADIRYVAHFNAWYIWAGHRWRRDEDGAIMRLAKSAVEKLFDEAAKIEDETLRTAMRKFALASQSCARLAAMVKLAESELPVVLSHKLLDADPMLLGVKNGVVELETGKFREGRREEYISKQCDVAYDPRAACPEWRKFQVTITSSDADLTSYKQRLAGVLLTGKLIEFLFIPWGCGSNGKSTELETYQAILGEYGHATDASLLLARKETTGPTPEIVALKGKRAVFINETPERARLNEARVKYLTGNDTLYGRGLHQEPINFQPTHKVIMRTNHKPIIRGTDHGIWRRIHLIPYTATITGGEPDFRQRKLMPELPGILNWMIEGLKAYHSKELSPPKAVCDATDLYKADMDLMAQWLAERCTLDRHLPKPPEKPSKTLLKELTADFNAWAKGDLRHPWANATLSEKLSGIGLASQHTMYGAVFAGIKLKPRGDGSFDFERNPYL